MQKELRLYVKSMGKIFRVLHLATSVEEANDYCEKHDKAAVIAEDTTKGIILIAEVYSSICKSSEIIDRQDQPATKKGKES